MTKPPSTIGVPVLVASVPPVMPVIWKNWIGRPLAPVVSGVAMTIPLTDLPIVVVAVEGVIIGPTNWVS